MRHWIPTLLLALLLGGCSTNTSGLVVRSDADKIKVDNASLAREVTVTQLHKSLMGGRLQGRADLVSKASGDLYLQYRFVFFDESGAEMESANRGWRAINLAGGERRQVSAVALSPGALEFELSVRRVVGE
ncbi:DUF1425 domain-containing protein [Ferrimonas sediminicola]|uniref:DUF1425 domain-containing protein n=1 Tax=Ferrimonas sediminicola TaxID=2569538 RepID=A0A4U1BHS5_9GAMM|nr:DUF1425 domain-containing protein [Ferrimonas sediminicola]TKB50617.1 DUF1425 domain-containing protein [Ferrimonas sediminicola]